MERHALTSSWILDHTPARAGAPEVAHDHAHQYYDKGPSPFRIYQLENG